MPNTRPSAHAISKRSAAAAKNARTTYSGRGERRQVARAGLDGRGFDRADRDLDVLGECALEQGDTIGEMLRQGLERDPCGLGDLVSGELAPDLDKNEIRRVEDRPHRRR